MGFSTFKTAYAKMAVEKAPGVAQKTRLLFMLNFPFGMRGSDP